MRTGVLSTDDTTEFMTMGNVSTGDRAGAGWCVIRSRRRATATFGSDVDDVVQGMPSAMPARAASVCTKDLVATTGGANSSCTRSDFRVDGAKTTWTESARTRR
jgi:hypothetical protein